MNQPKRAFPKNRISGALAALNGSTPINGTVGIQEDEELKKLFDEDLGFSLSDDDGDDGDDDCDDYDDEGDDEDDEDDDEDDEELDEYLEEVLEVATDEDAALTDARIIFKRDPENPKHIIMVARIEDIIPDEIDCDGDEMWEADIILRLNRGWGGALKQADVPTLDVFKKKNWVEKV